MKKNNIITHSIFTLGILICLCIGNIKSLAADVYTAEKLNSVIASRPRLYFPYMKKETIRNSLDKYPYKKFWKSIKKRVDYYQKLSNKRTISDFKDVRKFGYILIDLAFVASIEGTEQQMQRLREMMEDLVSHRDWENNDKLEAASLLYAMTLAFDWHYNRFSSSEKMEYRSKIKRHATLLHNAYKKKRKRWTKSYLQNMNYTITMAIGIAGYALLGEEKAAIDWVKSSDENLDTVFQYLSPDGSSHEGVNYWSYGVESLLFFYYATQPLNNGLNKIASHPFIKNTAKFRLYCALPGYEQNADFADSYRIEYHGPGLILRALASINNDGVAQRLAHNIENARGRTEYSWFDFIAYNPEIPEMSPDNLPTYHYFDNLGLLAFRSDWTNNSLWVLFKAGPSQGKLAEQKGYYAGSHIHPDEGHFSIWNQGDWLVVDDGYSLVKKTEAHNVLMFNNIGQLGEGQEWFNQHSIQKHSGTVKVIQSIVSENYHHVSADLTKIYPPDSELKLWIRDFFYVPDHWIVIADTVELIKPGKVRSHVHFKKQNITLDTENRIIRLENGNTLHYRLPFRHSVSIDETQQVQKVYGIPKKVDRHTLAMDIDFEARSTLILAFDLASSSDQTGNRFIQIEGSDVFLVENKTMKHIDLISKKIATNQ